MWLPELPEISNMNLLRSILIASLPDAFRLFGFGYVYADGFRRHNFLSESHLYGPC